MNAFTLIVAMLTASSGEPVLKATVADIAWMKGSWSCPMWGGTFEEHWTAPGGGTMLAVGRLTAAGKTNFMEFISIEPNSEGGLTMWIILDSPSKGEKKGVPFKLTSLKGKTAVWENPANEFPSKITYKAVGTSKIDCRISGMQGGRASHEDFAFKRMKS